MQNARQKCTHRDDAMGLIVLRAVMSSLLVFFISACATSPPITGTYGAQIPAASGPGRIIHLTLTDDKRVEMSTDYLNDRPAVTETGTWEALKGGDITVVITGRDSQTYEKPDVITFRLSGETIEAVGYDWAARGSEGLSLQKQPDITDREWLLTEIHSFNNAAVMRGNPAQYVLQLFHNGTVLVKADCNRGTGTFELVGKQLTFHNIGYTRELCLPGSLFEQYAKALEAAFSCMVRDEFLLIYSAADSGVLKFAPAK
jgi:heat shock protein HslJ